MSTTLFASGRAPRRRQKPQSNQRLDIQGLRMVAVMLVVLSHLFDWPQGGFIGVDVFFVISGFLITGSLLHTVEKTGRISFSSFYRRRIRRIVPAATLVLFATVAASYFVFSGSRFDSTVIDALWAFLFVSNWRFGLEGTDYFAAEFVSPLQHYWSLSVEEQFYFVWPVVILAVSYFALRKKMPTNSRLNITASVMGVAVVGSFAYSWYDTVNEPARAYFSTLTRVWELGVGALLAIIIRHFDRLPNRIRPFLAWGGLLTIGIGAFVISETGGGFPAPWAVLPVLGAAMIIGAGTQGGHLYLGFLTNRFSTYIGDISYSLYLWHWPVIILLAAVMDVGVYYYAAAIFLMFGLSIAAYHFFENPIRASKWLENSEERKDRSFLDVSRWRMPTLRLSETNQSVGIGALALITAGLAAIALVPPSVSTFPPTARVAPAQDATAVAKVLGPAQAALAEEIANSLQATSWPELNPSMDAAISGPQAPRDILSCGIVDRIDSASCTWGSPTAPRTIVILGDSIAMTYVQSLKNFAEGSDGQWKVRTEAMFGCTFVGIEQPERNNDIGAACPGRKDEAIAVVNEVRPDVVIISNRYDATPSGEWAAGMSKLTSQFAANVGKIVFLSAPPDDITIGDCFNRISSPADCISKVTPTWRDRARIEKILAERLNGLFIDSRPWFCTIDDYCPSFVGTTPVKSDKVHITPEYGAKISPAFAEALREAGI
ncbi:acyltransferase family protein [Rhodococcus pyridinivorans]|uniref:acyltransferase family protein n=1 Tax=Rhodococcus pyridinivorans TaxID=103816 RepID=UPI003D7FD103